MPMENDERFKKIENDGVIVGITKKDKKENRFEHLETGGEKTEKEEPVYDGKKYFPCFKCNRNNRIGNLYCIYCGEIFPDVAEKTESKLEPYEIKCPGCGRVGNKNQKRCMWCGYRFVYTDEDILKEGRMVQIEINGVKYKSTDAYLPEFIKDAMVKMKRDNLSMKDAENVLRGLQIKKSETRMVLLQDIGKNRERAVSYILTAIGGFLTFTALLLIHFKAGTLSLFLLLPGVVLIIAGMAKLAMTGPSGNDDPLRRHR